MRRRPIRDIHARGRLPILVGGTGLYYRALTRGLFPGPGKDDALRARLERVADRKGVEALHRLVGRVDPPSADRIQPRDRKRLVRALEVYLPDREAADGALRRHRVAAGRGRRRWRRSRCTCRRRGWPSAWPRRVDEQFDAGVLDEIRGLLAAGVPRRRGPFGGLVYRQALEHLRGVRDEAATRALIAQENRRYARRQLIWFRKEPNLVWFDGPGESPDVQASVICLLVERGLLQPP